MRFLCDRKSPVSGTLDRFQGYCDALRNYGIEYQNRDYYYLPDDKNLRRETLREFAGRIKKEGYTAAFVVSDYLANEVITMLSAEGIHVPEDISVTGFDDNMYAKLSVPPLTTIRQSVYEKGERAVKLLMQRIMGEEVLVNSFKLPVELIVRDSVKKYKLTGFVQNEKERIRREKIAGICKSSLPFFYPSFSTFLSIGQK